MKYVVSFSGGAGSYCAARRVCMEYGTDKVLLLFADTKMEDADTYRFIDDAQRVLGAELVTIADGRDPWQVFFDERFLGNSRIDPCSKTLKRKLLARWVKMNSAIYSNGAAVRAVCSILAHAAARLLMALEVELAKESTP